MGCPPLPVEVSIYQRWAVEVTDSRESCGLFFKNISDHELHFPSPSIHPQHWTCRALGGSPQTHQPGMYIQWHPTSKHHLDQRWTTSGHNTGPPEGRTFNFNQV